MNFQSKVTIIVNTTDFGLENSLDIYHCISSHIVLVECPAQYDSLEG